MWWRVDATSRAWWLPSPEMDLALIGMILDTSHRYHTRRYTLATQIHCKLLSDISINNHKGSHRENASQRVEILEFLDGLVSTTTLVTVRTRSMSAHNRYDSADTHIHAFAHTHTQRELSINSQPPAISCCWPVWARSPHEKGNTPTKKADTRETHGITFGVWFQAQTPL